MRTVTISAKFQLVIPKDIRTSMRLKAGEEILVIQHKNRIECIPKKELRRMHPNLKK